MCSCCFLLILMFKLNFPKIRSLFLIERTCSTTNHLWDTLTIAIRRCFRIAAWGLSVRVTKKKLLVSIIIDFGILKIKLQHV